MRHPDATTRGRVLLVEDEESLRLTFEEFLNEDGYDATVAANFEEAAEILNHSAFDVVVTDILLGSRTGVDLLRLIKDRGMSAPVVMITGQPSLESATEAVRLGAFDYLPKPVTETDLKRVVRLALDRKCLEAERDQYRSELAAIFHGVPAGLLMVDAELRIRQVNGAALAMFSLTDTSIGADISEIFCDPLKPVSEVLQQSVQSRRAIQDVRLVWTDNEGTEHVAIAGANPLITGKDRCDGAVAVIRDVTRLTYLEQQVDEAKQFRKLIGHSAGMRHLYQMIRNLADTDSTVLICGESGTGKELIADAIHESSPRSERPLIKVNCAALSDELLESELFGHVRGAFTGAIKDRIGRFEAADGGTLFLDEIGDVSPRLQLRLLRVLQEGEFQRVGDSRTLRVDVRVIAATNQNLQERIKTGEFREDLYYRLNVMRLEIPPLRDRKEDLPLLINHFVRRFNAKMKRVITGVSPNTMQLLMRYRWPGNVRELENCIERAFIVCRDTEIWPDHLPPEIAGEQLKQPAPEGIKVTPDLLEREIIIGVLYETDWNIAKSARKLGVARNTLYSKIQSYDIARPGSR